MRLLRRACLTAVTALGVLAALTGCGPPIIGTVGLIRADDGTLTAITIVCTGSIGTLMLSERGPVDPDQSSGHAHGIRRWELPEPVSRAGALTLEEAAGWLRSDRYYEAGGYGRGGVAIGPRFTTVELAALGPGQVLALDEDWESEAMTVPQFLGAAEELCG